MIKKSLLVACAVVASASIYYVHAVKVAQEEVSYKEFSSLYTSLFKESPANVWEKDKNNKPDCSTSKCRGQCSATNCTGSNW